MAAPYYDELKDLRETVAMGESFEQYVRQDQLYGITGLGGMFGGGPRLTVGAFAMRLRRLRMLENLFNAPQLEQLKQAESQFNTVQTEWRVHFEKKLVHEVNSRLDAMREFFRECQESQRTCASAYPAEAQRRTIAQEALRLVEAHGLDDDSLIGKVRKRDSQLRAVVEPADFMWSQTLQPVYPADEFWWLYSTPPAKSDN